jgi:hypothetical protein
MTTIERLQKITEALETITGEVIALVKEHEPAVSPIETEQRSCTHLNCVYNPDLKLHSCEIPEPAAAGTEIHEDKPKPKARRRRKAPEPKPEHAPNDSPNASSNERSEPMPPQCEPDADRMRAAPEPLVAAPVEPLPVPKAKRRAKTEPIVGQMALNGKSVAAPITERLPGTTVWAAYKSAYVERYGIEPLRSAKVNSQCLVLAQQVGVDEACILIAYFLQRNDAFYVNAAHPIGLCLQQAQKLITELKRGESMTMSRALSAEKHSTTDQAIQEYINDKGESA